MNKNKGSKKTKRKFQPIILTNIESNTRIVIRKNNPAQNKEKLSFMKYCPKLRKRILFSETKKERHLK